MNKNSQPNFLHAFGSLLELAAQMDERIHGEWGTGPYEEDEGITRARAALELYHRHNPDAVDLLKHLRNDFAAAALTGFGKGGQGNLGQHDPNYIARSCFDIADALVEESLKREKPSC